MSEQLVRANLPEFQSLPDSGAWVPLMEYALKNAVSLSTLRRYIKANKVVYKVVEGRYLLWDERASQPQVEPEKEPPELQDFVSQLQKDLRKAKEEIAELKTLIAFYEDSTSQSLLSG